VESFVGAIALGWLLADVIVHFANIFASPVASWITRSEYHELPGRQIVLTDFLFRDALPELIRTLLLTVVWYILLYWLYIRPVKNQLPDSIQTPENSV
jgi:hypothetical protein